MHDRDHWQASQFGNHNRISVFGNGVTPLLAAYSCRLDVSTFQKMLMFDRRLWILVLSTLLALRPGGAPAAERTARQVLTSIRTSARWRCTPTSIARCGRACRWPWIRHGRDVRTSRSRPHQSRRTREGARRHVCRQVRAAIRHDAVGRRSGWRIGVTRLNEARPVVRDRKSVV